MYEKRKFIKFFGQDLISFSGFLCRISAPPVLIVGVFMDVSFFPIYFYGGVFMYNTLAVTLSNNINSMFLNTNFKFPFVFSFMGDKLVKVTVIFRDEMRAVCKNPSAIRPNSEMSYLNEMWELRDNKGKLIVHDMHGEYVEEYFSLWSLLNQNVRLLGI